MAKKATGRATARTEPEDDDGRDPNDPRDEDLYGDPLEEEEEEGQDPAGAVDPVVADPVVFALCPGQVNPDRPLDYNKAADVNLYKAATEPFNKDKPFDVESAGLMQFMMEVHNPAMEHGWTDPNHGLCIIEVRENNATERYDLTTQYGCVSIDQVVASDMRELQPNTRKAQNSMMLHKLLMGCLSLIGKNKVMTPEYQRKTSVNGQPSGNVLLKIITEIARPQTPASVQMLRNNITTMADRMAEFGQDIEKFNAYVIEQIQGLAAFGQTYDNIEYHLFNAYDKCTDQVFHAYLTKIKDQHETGEVSYTYDQVMRYAVVNKYHLMVQRGEWSPEKGSLDDRLLALESKTGRTPRRNQKGKKKPSGEGNQESRYAPKGGNWIHEPPKGGVDKKATIVRKTRKGEKTFYWCHRKTGGQCDPGVWRTHKPEECRSDELKAKREKEQKEEKPKGKSLRADQTIITNLHEKDDDKGKEDDEKSITSEERRIAHARYDPYASEQSLSSVDEMKVWGDPDYLVRRYRQQAKEMERAKKFHEEREKREAKNYAKKQRKEARKLLNEQEKGENPYFKKARSDLTPSHHRMVRDSDWNAQ